MFTIELFTEDEFDSVEEFQVESLSEIPEKLKSIEENEDIIVDYLKLTEGEDSRWYLVDDDLTISEANEEDSLSLDEDFGEEIDNLISESGWFEELLSEELEDLDEQLKRRVSSSGKVSRVRSKQVRSRRATRTTGMSKSALKRRARKSAKARRRDVGGTKRATKKRKKAMRRRRSMGIR